MADWRERINAALDSSQSQRELYNGFLFDQARNREAENQNLRLQRPTTPAGFTPQYEYSPDYRYHQEFLQTCLQPATSPAAAPSPPFIPFGGLYSAGPATTSSIVPRSRNSGVDNSDSTEDENGGKNEKRYKRWHSVEVKQLIEAYRNKHLELAAARNPRAKKSIWMSIFDEFKCGCNEVNFPTEKDVDSLKEKWRHLFQKYKAVTDLNSKTGQARETFEFYEEMDEFLGCSDKVRPKYIRESTILNKANKSRPEGERDTSSPESADSPQASNRDLDKEDEPSTSGEGTVATPKSGKAATAKTRKRKASMEKKQGTESSTETDIVKLLKVQQEAIVKSEEKDDKMMEALLKFQEDSDKRHQEFMMNVLGKLGDIFKPKN